MLQPRAASSCRKGSSFVSFRIITPYSGKPDVALLYQRFLQPKSCSLNAYQYSLQCIVSPRVIRMAN
jgi:hypothetical protein